MLAQLFHWIAEVRLSRSVHAEQVGVKLRRVMHHEMGLAFMSTKRLRYRVKERGHPTRSGSFHPAVVTAFKNGSTSAHMEQFAPPVALMGNEADPDV